MSVLPRVEQEKLVVSFERDYGRLVMNCRNDKLLFAQKVSQLAEQISKSANPNYFEDDIVEYFNMFSAQLQKQTKH